MEQANIEKINIMNEIIPMTRLTEITDMVNTYRQGVYQGPIKPSSMKQYIQNWNRLFTQVKTKWEGEFPDNWFDDVSKVMDCINDMRDKRYPDKIISLSSRRNYLSALIQFGQVHNVKPETIKEYTSWRTIMNSDLTGKVKDEGTALLTTKDEVQKKVFDVLENGKFIWSCGLPVIHYYMLMKLHMAYNLRNDCASLNFITKRHFNMVDKTAKNWLVGTAQGRGKFLWTIHLNDYKTKKEGDGPHIIECDKNMSKLINKYYVDVWHKTWASDDESKLPAPCFVKGLDESGSLEGLTSNDMTLLMLKYNEIYLGKKIGTKMLRHSFYTEKYGGMAEELKEDAKNSLHSVGTAINHYTNTTETPNPVSD